MRTPTPAATSAGRDERGSALVGVLLLLMMMSALAAALGVSGRTETLVARNHHSSAQARAAAEAGLNRAAEVVSSWIFEWKANGYADVDVALDALLANPALLSPDIDFGTLIDLPGATGVQYQVFLMDEDDPDRGVDQTDLTGDGDATNDEDNVETTDNNRSIVILATGYTQDETEVTMEAIVSPLPLPAIVTNGDLEISGSVTVDGTAGDVHSNGNLTTNGSGESSSISGDITASGTYSGSLGGTSGSPELPIPTVRAADYRFHADYLLTSAGLMQCEAQAGCLGGTFAYGALICDASPSGNPCRSTYGVQFDSGSVTWSFVNSAVSGTYYVQGSADISGPGSASTPVSLTIIAEGSIDLGGSTYVTPATPELLLVTDVDLDISGGGATGELDAAGQILVHEQISISGSPEIAGQLIVEDAVDTAGSPISANSISGNPHITYNGNLGTGVFSVNGWREIRR